MKTVRFTKSAHADFEYWKKENPKLHTKIIELLKAIQKDPFKGIGKPEALKHSLKGNWSRRINREHRLVYKIDKKTIWVVSCRYHY